MLEVFEVQERFADFASCNDITVTFCSEETEENEAVLAIIDELTLEMFQTRTIVYKHQSNGVHRIIGEFDNSRWTTVEDLVVSELERSK